MTKIKAALVHVLISIFVISIFASIIFFIWYPKPFVAISGVLEPLKLLIIVDVIIGPLLTFIVFKKNKKYLKLDLTLIALFQLVALGYGIHTIYNGKPSMVVMYNGQFNYLSEKFSNHDQLKFDELKPGIFNQPKLAYISIINSNDIYSAYGDMKPLGTFEESLLSYSLNSENMKAKFKNKADEIERLTSKYGEKDIAFFLLDKDGSKYYVFYSKSKKKIVEYLKF